MNIKNYGCEINPSTLPNSSTFRVEMNSALRLAVAVNRLEYTQLLYTHKKCLYTSASCLYTFKLSGLFTHL